MRRGLSRWARPPREVHCPRVQSDNAVLVPASELVALRDWQERARQLPAGVTLVVVPGGNRRLRQVGWYIGQTLSRQGRRAHLTILSTSR